MRWGIVRAFEPILLGILALQISSNAFAVCTLTPIVHGFSSFEQCGPNAHAFFWHHGRAVQKDIGFYPTTGNDSGPNQTETQGMYLDGPNGGKSNGSYQGNSDWGNRGVDNCILEIKETNTGCLGGPNLGVTNYVISGVDPQQPNLARMAVISVDYNEIAAAWFLDNAGAPSLDGDPCGADATSFYRDPVNCAAIPMPILDGAAMTSEGTVLTLGIGDTSGIPFLDDCLIAEDRATNCPRNLYAGRALLFKRGNCEVETGAAFDRRSYVFPPYPSSGTVTVTPNWPSFSREDANLNGSLDPGEDGSRGGAVNGELDPLIIPGTGATSTEVLIPTDPEASDCIFLALGILLDENRLSLDPPYDTFFGEAVMSPDVSVNPEPIPLSGTTQIPDVVTKITAVLKAGIATIQWTTSNELHTRGFNVVGSKNNGRERRLNGDLIPANEGTSGEGSSYTETFEARELKGTSHVFIEVIKTDGTIGRFGPVYF